MVISESILFANASPIKSVVLFVDVIVTDTEDEPIVILKASPISSGTDSAAVGISLTDLLVTMFAERVASVLTSFTLK